jgi:hypothetical protein
MVEVGDGVRVGGGGVIVGVLVSERVAEGIRSGTAVLGEAQPATMERIRVDVINPKLEFRPNDFFAMVLPHIFDHTAAVLYPYPTQARVCDFSHARIVGNSSPIRP